MSWQLKCGEIGCSQAGIHLKIECQYQARCSRFIVSYRNLKVEHPFPYQSHCNHFELKLIASPFLPIIFSSQIPAFSKRLQSFESRWNFYFCFPRVCEV